MGFEFIDREQYTIASYTPRAFFIQLNFDTQDNEIEFPSFSQVQLATLMHECGHLVQDRATLYGVQDFIHFYNSFWSIRAYADSVPSPQPLAIPLRTHIAEGRIPGTTEPCWLYQLEAIRGVTYSYSRWRDGDARWAFLGHRVTEQILPYRAGTRTVRRVDLDLVDHVMGEPYAHALGAWEVKEAYSSNIQVLHGDAPQRPDDGYEYLIVERILTTVFRDPTVEHVVAICHWALQSMEPAVELFDIIAALEEEFGHDLAHANSVYDFCRDRARGRGYEAERDRLLEILDHLAAEHRQMNADGQLSQIFTWYAATARQLLNLNLEARRRFPLDTFLCARSLGLRLEERERQMRELFTEIPVPMLESLNGHWYAFGGNSIDDGHVFFIRSLKGLVDLIWAGAAAEWECPLYPRCPLQLRDDECRHHPWRKGLARPTCPYGAAARLLHVQDRMFTVN